MRPFIKVLKLSVISSLISSSFAYAYPVEPPIDPDIDITPPTPPMRPVESPLAPTPPIAPLPLTASAVLPIAPVELPTFPPVTPVTPALPPVQATVSGEVKAGEVVNNQHIGGTQYVYGVSNAPILSPALRPNNNSYETNGTVFALNGGIVNNATVSGEGRLFARLATINNGVLSGNAVAITEGLGALSNNLVLSENAKLYVQQNSQSINATLTDSAIQVVSGGKALNTALSGNAEQHIGHPYSHRYETIADGNILTDSAIQKVWSRGTALNTTLNGNAVQSVFITHNNNDYASAIKTTLNNNTQQQISGLGATASDNTLTDSSAQIVWNNGKALNTVLSGHAQQQISGSGTIGENNYLTDNTVQMVWDGGKVLNTILNGSAIQAIGSSGQADDTVVNDSASVVINGDGALANKTLLNSGNMQIINGMAVDTTVNGSSILTLEQQGNLQGNTTLNGGRLVINGSDMVIGTSSDIINANTNTLIQVNGDNNTVSNLNLNGAYVALTNPFTSARTNLHNTLNIDTLTGSGTFLLDADLEATKGDVVQIKNASGEHGVLVKSSGYNPLIANPLNIIAAKEGNATFQLKNKGEVVDLGTYQYYLTNNTDAGGTMWSLTPTADNSISPATDAVLSMASATQFIADGEMQSLRSRHGDLRNNVGDNAGVWGRFLLNNTRIYAAEGASYELKQSGMELGADHVVSLASGKLVLGGIAVFSDNTLNHSRGGQSSIDSYGIGGYATYFNHSGYYIDTVLKYNYFSDNLSAVMTDGALTKGSYTQNALTTSVEAGLNYNLNDSVWAEPYIRGTYFVTGNQNFALDNGMQGRTGVTRSARIELGSTLGMNYTLPDGKTLRPYVRAALENEFIKNNTVVVNGIDEFNNNFSGVTGKYGIGISADLSNKSSVYAEANYRKGHNVESPVVANIGFRINF